MSDAIQNRLAARAAAAEARDGNQGEAVQGGGEKKEYKLAPEGRVKARLVGYIERGPQPRKPYKGVPKDPANQFVLRFALFGSGDAYKNDDGSPILVDSRPFTSGRSELSLALKVFVKMCPKKDAANFIGLLNRVFWLDIVHRKGEAKDGKEAPVFVNIDGDILPATKVVLDADDNPTGEVIEVACPAVEDKLFQIYEWDVPSKEDFESLRKSDQTKLRKSTAFKGSALEALVGGNPAAADAPEEGEPEQPEDDVPEQSGADVPAKVEVSADDMPAL